LIRSLSTSTTRTNKVQVLKCHDFMHAFIDLLYRNSKSRVCTNREDLEYKTIPRRCDTTMHTQYCKNSAVIVISTHYCCVQHTWKFVPCTSLYNPSSRCYLPGDQNGRNWQRGYDLWRYGSYHTCVTSTHRRDTGTGRQGQ